MTTIEKIKDLCKEYNISISKLEKDLGFSNGYINSLKKGIMPDYKLDLVADYFGVKKQSLISNKDILKPKAAQEHIRLISLYERLSDNDKLHILGILESLAK